MNNLKTDDSNVLVIAIGNCGRNDDGLGWKFADYLRERGTGNMDIEYRYQLQVEDALLVSGYDLVFFVDASHANLPAIIFFHLMHKHQKQSFTCRPICIIKYPLLIPLALQDSTGVWVLQSAIGLAITLKPLSGILYPASCLLYSHPSLYQAKQKADNMFQCFL